MCRLIKNIHFFQKPSSLCCVLVAVAVMLLLIDVKPLLNLYLQTGSGFTGSLPTSLLHSVSVVDAGAVIM
jgi:hypothetical protein